MAKDKGDGATVEVPVTVLERMQARLDALERAAAVGAEKADGLHEKRVYDDAWEAKVAEAARSPADRTQALADRTYGAKGARWRVTLDSTGEDGRPGPRVEEHPSLVIAANSPEEAQGRWLKLCGVRKHDYRLRAERIAEAPAPVAA